MRRDIQLLRGVAVLLVVIFHSNLGIVSYGYLGVDVFFVVSGFLITSIILRDLSTQQFLFSAFYLRRAKRLLPALYTTLLCTSVLAYWFLTQSQWDDFIAQLYGSLTFSANMVLPTQIGYFDAAAEGKPLLHIWSLSLEEQYYFFLPFLLFITPKKWRLTALILLTIISITWCIKWVSQPENEAPLLWRLADSKVGEWAFYLFPTRAWELLTGSICAWIMLHKPTLNIHPAIKFVALTTLFIVSSINIDASHPRGDAMIIVVATAIILLGQDNWLPKLAPIKWIERVGDWSYSVYLVHWPIFAFAYLAHLGEIPENQKIPMIIVALLLGYAQYRFVETPFRYGWKEKTRTTWAGFAIATMAVFLIPAPAIMVKSHNNDAGMDFDEIRKVNYGLSKKCDEWITGDSLNSKCSTGENPQIAVWGDSYAMHLVPGISKWDIPFIQLTKGVCGPFPGIGPVSAKNKKYGRAWAEKCIQHNDQVIKKITSTHSITHVIMGSTFGQYLGSWERQFLYKGKVIEKNLDLAIQSLIAAIETLRRAGKIPIVVSPPPRSGFNVGECLERTTQNAIVFRTTCEIALDEYLELDKLINDDLKTVVHKTDVPIIWLKDSLCDGNICRTEIDGTFIYLDGGHITVNGSEKILAPLKSRFFLPLNQKN